MIDYDTWLWLWLIHLIISYVMVYWLTKVISLLGRDLKIKITEVYKKNLFEISFENFIRSFCLLVCWHRKWNRFFRITDSVCSISSKHSSYYDKRKHCGLGIFIYVNVIHNTIHISLKRYKLSRVNIIHI